MTLIKELKSATKIGPIYFSDILFVAVYWIMLFFLRNHVATSLRIVYFIFNFAVAVILVMPSMWNPGKRMWQAILFIFVKDRKIYKPISVYEGSENFEDE